MAELVMIWKRGIWSPEWVSFNLLLILEIFVCCHLKIKVVLRHTHFGLNWDYWKVCAVFLQFCSSIPREKSVKLKHVAILQVIYISLSECRSAYGLFCADTHRRLFTFCTLWKKYKPTSFDISIPYILKSLSWKIEKDSRCLCNHTWLWNI